MPRFGGLRYGGFRMRRFGVPMFGMGMRMGSPLITALFGGGLGYLLGSRGQQQQPAPQAQAQSPNVQPQQAAPAPAANDDDRVLAQLKLLGELRDKGVLSDDEFVREKKRLLER
jgi:hypothetical protein